MKAFWDVINLPSAPAGYIRSVVGAPADLVGNPAQASSLLDSSAEEWWAPALHARALA